MGLISLTDVVPDTEIQSSPINNNNATLEAVINGGIEAVNIATGAVTGAELASDVLGAYRVLVDISATLRVLTSGNIYYPRADGAPGTSGLNEIGICPVGVIYLASADFALTGRTTQLRLRAQVFTNATAPGVTLTAGVYPVSSVGGTGGGTSVTLGTVLSGSTVAFATPAANSVVEGNSGTFAFPSNGVHIMGVILSGAQAANSAVIMNWQLAVRYS